MTYLAVPIAAGDLDHAKRQIKTAQSCGAELLELRIDYLDSLSVQLVQKLIEETRTITHNSLPIIVTCRSSMQGGAKAWPVSLRVKVLTAALKAGAEFIDFEYEDFLSPDNQERIKLAISNSLKGRLILSAHNFKTKFENIEKLHRRILTLHPAAIPKLVYTANHINDCFEAFDLLHRTSGDRIAFCMGAPGLITRIIAKKLGSFLTFASLDDATATAPGQITAAQLKKLYRHNDITPNTALYGIIASPVAHSLSPLVHNNSFSQAKLDKLYLPILLEGGSLEFDRFLNNVSGRPWLTFKGFSVSIPHKANALNYTRKNQGSIEPLAKKIGAANTLIIDNDRRLHTYNTDYAGALDAITAKMKIKKTDLKNLPVAVVGAGGAARAIVAGLSDAGAKITIYNRTEQKGRNLAADFNCSFEPLEKLPTLQADLLINCTSIGMSPNINESIVPEDCLKNSMIVFDTVYNPPKTKLLQQAKAKTINGIEMFVNQAAAQFKLFTKKTADNAFIRKLVTNQLIPSKPRKTKIKTKPSPKTQKPQLTKTKKTKTTKKKSVVKKKKITITKKKTKTRSKTKKNKK